MQKPIVSIIIPCYNSGRYLPDALDSLKTYPVKNNYEVIIVNDGSTDKDTIELLEQLKNNGYIVLQQENKGPAAARNIGVLNAKGKFIFLLDSDNKIRGEYISKGIGILVNQPEIDIVHGKPIFFGDTDKSRFCTGPFDMNKILKENYIDTCVMMKKSVWNALNGQDENRSVIGHEDWDFWIRAGVAGYNFCYLDEILYEYRVLSTSLVAPLMDKGGNEPVLKYIYGKHAILINNQYSKIYNLVDIYKDDQKRPFRSFVKFLYRKYWFK